MERPSGPKTDSNQFGGVGGNARGDRAQTIDQLNSGTRKDLIPSRLDIPDYLLSHPTLEAKYVSHEDISRMVIKQYTGWWNDIPSHWSPATFDQQLAPLSHWQVAPRR